MGYDVDEGFQDTGYCASQQEIMMGWDGDGGKRGRDLHEHRDG